MNDTRQANLDQYIDAQRQAAWYVRLLRRQKAERALYEYLAAR